MTVARPRAGIWLLPTIQMNTKLAVCPLMNGQKIANRVTGLRCLAWVLVLYGCGGGGGGGAGTGGGVASNVGQSKQLPAISGNPPAAVTVGNTYMFLPSATPPDAGVRSFSIANQPAWTAFDTGTGLLWGTPDPGDVGEHNHIVISVSDQDSSDSLAPFTIEVLGTAAGAITLSWDPPATRVDGSPLLDLAGYRIYLGTQPGVYGNLYEISDPGMTTYVLDTLAPGTYVVAMTAVDASGKESGLSPNISETI